MLDSENHKWFIEEVDLDAVESRLENRAMYGEQEDIENEMAFWYLRQWRSQVLGALTTAMQFKKPMLVTLADVLVAAGIVKPEDLDTALGTPGLTKVVAMQNELVANYKELPDGEAGN